MSTTKLSSRCKVSASILAFLTISISGACAVKKTEPVTSSTPSPAQSTINETTPLTLPELDAFFEDQGFVNDLKNRVGLNDEQINRLREAARKNRSELSESDEYEGRTEAARKQAEKTIKGIIGADKAAQLYALVRERWGSTDEAGKNLLPPIEKNAVPSDTRIVVNAPAYRMDIFENGRLIKSYQVGIGYPEFPLGIGLRQAKQIIFNPTWTPPDEPWVSGNNVQAGQKIEAGSKLNPLGVAKIPIGLPALIHGGKAAAKIGGFASHGCVGLTNEQMIEFSKLIARLGGATLTNAQIAQYRKNPTETKTIDLPNPVPVELRYESIVVEDGQLHIYRDVYERGTNTEENLRRVLEAHEISFDNLTEEEKMQALDAINEMGRNAKGEAIQDDVATLSGSPSPKPKKSASPKVTRQIKGEKESLIAIPMLQGKNGYPLPVALNAPQLKATPKTGKQ